jgi:hypothetical protein
MAVYLTVETCFARARAYVENNKAWRAEAAEREALAKPRLAKLKQEMIAAHPDRGGTSEKFIAAHIRYKIAKGK